MAMKVGLEDKKKVYFAAGLGVVMLFLLVRVLWQTFGPSPEAPAAPASTVIPARPASARNDSGSQAPRVGGLAALDPTLHPELMRSAESLAYTGNGRNIFSQFSAPPSIPKPVAAIRQAKIDTGPPPPPPPPPINLGYYGYAAEKTGHKQVFLLHGDDIFIASEGDVVDRRYRVVKINAASVQVEDIPYHNTQTLPLRQ
jgi:hypothetical protein